MIAATLLFVLGLAHSYLGERLLIGPLIRRPLWPADSPRGLLGQRTLRFAWHLTSVAWWAMAVLLLWPSLGAPLVVGVFAIVSGLIAAFGSRGAHAAWLVFMLIGALCLANVEPVAGWALAERQVFALIGAIVLLALAVLHITWAFGKEAPSDAVVPTRDGKPSFRPTRAMTLAVALALMIAAASLALATSSPLAKTLSGLVGAAFLLRAIGDFRYVGATKRVRATRFARWDDAVYTPTCALLAIAGAAAWI
ncbi:MAG: DUF3995 domain-containing protein [Myxococcota bacterium]